MVRDVDDVDVVDVAEECPTREVCVEDNDVCLSLFVFAHEGTIHGDEGSVHEEWPGLCLGLLHHSAVNIQRPP